GPAALGGQGLVRFGRGPLPMPDPPGLDVLEQPRHRFGRVLLVRADDSRRAAFDPAGAVRAVGTGHTPAVVLDRAARLVERHVRQTDAAISDTAEHEATRKRLMLVCGHRDEAAVTLLEAVAHQLDPLD